MSPSNETFSTRRRGIWGDMEASAAGFPLSATTYRLTEHYSGYSDCHPPACWWAKEKGISGMSDFNRADRRGGLRHQAHRRLQWHRNAPSAASHWGFTGARMPGSVAACVECLNAPLPAVRRESKTHRYAILRSSNAHLAVARRSARPDQKRSTSQLWHKACRVACSEWSDLRDVGGERADLAAEVVDRDALHRTARTAAADVAIEDGCMPVHRPSGCRKACPSPARLSILQATSLISSASTASAAAPCITGCPFNVPRISKRRTTRTNTYDRVGVASVMSDIQPARHHRNRKT